MSRRQRARWRGWAAGSRKDLHGHYDHAGDWHPPYVPPMPKAKPAPLRRTRKEPGIRPEQAHELAVLQRAVGEPYSGNGMRASQADREIARLKQLLSQAAR